LLKGEIGKGQLSKDGPNPGNIKFRSHDHGALPAVRFKYLNNLHCRLVGPGGLPFNKDRLAGDPGQHQPLRLQAGLIKAAVTAARAYDHRRKT